MSYQKITAIKKEIESFKNAELISLAEDSKVAVRNTSTNAIYVIPYSEEDGNYVFDCENAEIVNEKDESSEELFAKNSQVLQDKIGAIFAESENLENAIAELRDTVRELPQVDPAQFGQTAELVQEQESPILPEKMAQYAEIEREFMNSFNMFDESGDPVQSKVSVTHFKKLYKEVKSEWNDFIEAIGVYHEFKVKLLEEIEDERIVEALLDNISLDEKINITVPKALVVAKNTIDEDLNIIETSKKVIGLWNSVFEDVTPTSKSDKIYNYAQNDRERPKFLKFRMGVFTVEDVMVLIEELDRAMSAVGELNDEELMFISNQKYICEYMVRTRKVSDRMMKKVITEFNERFSAKNDDLYVQSQFGFKDRDEQKMGNITGKAKQ